MKLRVRNFVNKSIKYEEKDIEIDITQTVEDIMNLLIQAFELTEKSEKVVLFLTSFPELHALKELNRVDLIKNLNLKESDILTIKIKEKEITINIVTGLIIAYSGPILVALYFGLKTGFDNLTLTQIIAMFMSNFHYIKLILEALVDIRAQESKPISKVILNTLFYWLIYGYPISSYLFTLEFSNQHSFNSYVMCVCVAGFAFSEFNNYNAHITLMKLKIKHKGKRGIPEGGMFNYVSCANYFWELISWVFFAFFVNVFPAYLWIGFSFLIMSIMAFEKHSNYVKNFPNYPKNRKAILPLIL